MGLVLSLFLFLTYLPSLSSTRTQTPEANNNSIIPQEVFYKAKVEKILDGNKNG